MTQINVLNAPLTTVHSWAEGNSEALSSLSGINDTCTVWITLCDDRIVETREMTEAGPTYPLVFIIYQNGMQEAPEKIWPMCLHYINAVARNTQQVDLILTGEMISHRYAEWVNWLNFVSDTPLPLRRLLLLSVLKIIAYGNGFFIQNRAVQFVSRLFRKM